MWGQSTPGARSEVRAGCGEPGSLQAAHLKDLCSCPELVAVIPVVEKVNGLAHVVPGILDLKTVPALWLVGWDPAGRCARFTTAMVSQF